MAEIIPFPRAPITPQARLTAAIARLNTALERQREVLETWRVADAEPAPARATPPLP